MSGARFTVGIDLGTTHSAAAIAPVDIEGARPEVLRYIDPVLAILQRNQFVSVFNSVVHPVRHQAGRVEAILASPTLADDPVVVEVRALQ